MRLVAHTVSGTGFGTAFTTGHVTAFVPAAPFARHLPTRPHPSEGLALGNVYSGVVRASLYREFTTGARWESLSGVCVTAVESRPPGALGASSTGNRGQRPFGARVMAFVALTKPRIIELLLITTVPVMFLAEQGVPDLWLVLNTCIGGYLSAGGANALNMYIDRDIDALMERTARRPLVTGMVSPREGLVFGLTLAVVSTLWFGLLVNWLSAWLSLGALLFYVVVYTMILKRRTAQNIVWGGIAGCMPVLIGWSSVTDSMSWAAVILFLVIFFWTPPHYWPLSMKVKDDYARVGVPMLPVIAGNKAVARQIVVYSWVMVAVSLLLQPLGYTGWFYTAVALAAGGWWLWEAHALQSRAKGGVTGGKLKEMRLFHWSITYVSLLFVAVAVDPFLR
ncbi:protoheme IX farnesyltransferase [Streptomyces ruber]|uniref:Protoheme IX farnesyltransferase n=2 Tax=Streptomyces TaxID=1883 RepID=A0A918BMA8_9ACTN|nr:protoheme IX farnesyltransferase [Streptomyces ruber]